MRSCCMKTDLMLENKGAYCCLMSHLPTYEWLESWTLKQHVQFICNNQTTAICAYPVTFTNMMICLWL